LVLAGFAFACGGPREKKPEFECIIPAPKLDTLSMDSFTYPQRQAWDEATKAWYQDVYFGGCLKAGGFQLNCTDCTNLGLKLQFRVDGMGRVSECKEISAKIYCHGHTEAQETQVGQCLIESFPKVVLPEPFFQKVIVAYIGRVPSC
jgi:hypothetical protein